MYGNRKVGFVGILSVLLLDDYVRGNQFRKVVHSKSGKNLLENVLRLFCMKMKQTDGVLQFSEGCFNPPTQGIELFQFSWWKQVHRQVSNYSFKGVFGDWETDNPKR